MGFFSSVKKAVKKTSGLGSDGPIAKSANVLSGGLYGLANGQGFNSVLDPLGVLGLGGGGGGSSGYGSMNYTPPVSNYDSSWMAPMFQQMAPFYGVDPSIYQPRQTMPGLMGNQIGGVMQQIAANPLLQQRPQPQAPNFHNLLLNPAMGYRNRFSSPVGRW